MRWGKFSLNDVDPRNLSARPAFCFLLGLAMVLIAGWFLVMDFWAWPFWLMFIAGLALIIAALIAGRREIADRDESSEAGA